MRPVTAVLDPGHPRLEAMPRPVRHRLPSAIFYLYVGWRANKLAAWTGGGKPSCGVDRTTAAMPGRAAMRRHSSTPRWFGAVLIALLLAGCAAEAPTASAPPLGPDMARVWFLRQADPTGGNVYASQPVVYVDRTPLVTIQQGTAFFHDFAPGRYRLSAQAVVARPMPVNTTFCTSSRGPKPMCRSSPSAIGNSAHRSAATALPCCQCTPISPKSLSTWRSRPALRPARHQTGPENCRPPLL